MMKLSWIYLLVAGVLEIGWPLGFKLSQVTELKYFWIGFAVVSMAGSGYFLWLAQREIPIGTAYLVWTGIGALGTFFIGILFFKDPANFLRMASAMLIVMGIIGIKISSV